MADEERPGKGVTWWDFPDYLRLRESQEALYTYLQGQNLNDGTCPSCGSVFLLHICHANPVKGKGVAEAKPRAIKGLRADRVILDEITDWDNMSLGERRIKES